jgi:hypothetical protein
MHSLVSLWDIRYRRPSCSVSPRPSTPTFSALTACAWLHIYMTASCVHSIFQSTTPSYKTMQHQGITINISESVLQPSRRPTDHSLHIDTTLRTTRACVHHLRALLALFPHASNQDARRHHLLCPLDTGPGLSPQHSSLSIYTRSRTSQTMA